jgi:hypothetical protein
MLLQMPLAQLIAMHHLPDTTKNKVWLAEQMDRLLAFEVLKKICIADPEPISPELLADKIGLNKGFSYNMMNQIARRLKHAN